MKFQFGALLLVLAACGPVPVEDEPAIVTEVVEPEVPEEPPALEQCDAADYRPLIGTPLVEAAVVSGERMRVFNVNDIITQEYLPQRTNVVSDDEGLIARVYCG
ncbi:MAG: hypothetical protein HKP37_11790 [Boseongicola sp.]|nr:hypothetical protein [Boseongicola sp.]